MLKLPWEHGHLGDIVKIVMGQSPSSINYTDNPEDHILVQGNADLENGHVVPRVWTKQVTKTADKDDIILSVRAPVGDVGITNYPIVIGRGVAAIKGNKFIYQLLDKMNQDSFWRKYSTGSTFESINSNDLKKAEIFHPNEPEQEKIGKLFQSLDRAIYLHEEKRKQLEQLKKALLQKMFADKTNFPEIRFNGYVGPWEQRHFFDNIKKTIDFRGRTPKKLGMDWSKSGYLALSALNVKDGYIDYSADAHYANQKLYDKWMSGNNLVKGQVLFTTEAPMGNVAQVPDNKGYVLSQRTIAFVTNKDKITDDFLASILRTPQSFKRLSALSSGGTAKGVSQKSLSSFKLVIPPSLKEQEKIGKLFRSFEHTIYLHAKKIESLKQLKQALLQQMFI